VTDIIDHLIPSNELTILGGAGQAGKTTLLMQILAQIQAKARVFGMFLAQPDLDMVYIAADRTWRSYKITAASTGLDVSRLRIKALIDDPTFDHHAFELDPFHYFRAVLTSLLPNDHTRHTVIIVDPLIIWLGCDTNRYHMVASKLILLNKLCNEFNITLIGTHHATKARIEGGFKRPQDRLSGSAALTGFTSTQLFLSLPEECETPGGQSELTISTHHAAPLTIWLDRDDHGLFHLSDHQPTSKQDSLTQRIVAFVTSNGTVTRSAIIDHLEPLDVSVATIDRSLKRLKHDGAIISPAHGAWGSPTS